MAPPSPMLPLLWSALLAVLLPALARRLQLVRLPSVAEVMTFMSVDAQCHTDRCEYVVVEQAHEAPCVSVDLHHWQQPNAAPQPLPKARAKRTLEAVRCKAL